ncbi:hypothetical protein C8R44DRAFT_625989 [Mycena epipterygia]|nr:hypothetical protein C8R44DRAFT_625989 [Mycena epipterygia]
MYLRSTRNTRVERLWVEVGSQFARCWRGFFSRLERLHKFDPHNPHHLWLLHHLFLADINKDCEEFQEQWNHHPISGKGHDQTPADMRLIGELKYGQYADNFDDIHPDVVGLYGDQGVCWFLPGTERRADKEADDLDLAIAGDQDHHIRHDAIEVVENECPFAGEDSTALLFMALKEIELQGIVPRHFGVAEAEWEGQFYGETETVKIGRKNVEIQLPFGIWWPRAVAWAQALETMVRIQAVENGEMVI